MHNLIIKVIMAMLLQIAYYMHSNIQKKQCEKSNILLNGETTTVKVWRGATFFLPYFDSGTLIKKKLNVDSMNSVISHLS